MNPFDCERNIYPSCVDLFNLLLKDLCRIQKLMRSDFGTNMVDGVTKVQTWEGY
jgi:hypothetical protein